MQNKLVTPCFLAIVIFLLSACASREPVPMATNYPPTDKVETIFQIRQASPSCRVFAHLFAIMPANMKIGDFTARASEEAKSRGAEMMLVGQARLCTTGSSLSFSYYGPDREYMVSEWPGWSYGFDEWGEQGSWASIGYDEWRDDTIHYDYPVVMQLVFIRCRQ